MLKHFETMTYFDFRYIKPTDDDDDDDDDIIV